MEQFSTKALNFKQQVFTRLKKTGATYLFLFLLLIGLNLNAFAQDWTQTCKTLPLDESAEGYGYGKAVAVEGDYSVVGAPYASSNQGIVYVLYNNGSTWETIAELTASDELSGWFGSSVSIRDETIVVGALFSNDSVSDAGAAYIFTKPSGGWVDMTQTAKITPTDGVQYDYFGESVSISGDNIVVGAGGYDTSKGSAYVFTKPESGWVDTTQTAKITASDSAASDRFGASVSISDEIIAVGSHYDDDNGENSGSVYVFTKPESGWATTSTHLTKLTASDGVASDRFGYSVIISDENIVVGAVLAEAAYVFTKPESGWADVTQSAKLTAYDGDLDDRMGISVSISGDNIVVGAYSNEDKGSAYVFTKPESAWVSTSAYTAKLTASDGNQYDRFGGAVSISGNFIIIGSPRDDDNGENSGSAFFYTTKLTIQSIERQSPTLEYVSNASLVFRVTFNGNANNVDASDFEVSSSSSTTATIANVTMINAYVYDITVSGGDLSSFEGEVGLSMSANADIVDDEGDALYLVTPATNEVYIIDNTLPTIALSTNETTVTGNFDVSITFSEEVKGFETSDITVSNGSVNGALVIVDSVTYIASITPLTGGEITLNVASSVVQDIAENNNEAASELIVTANFSTSNPVWAQICKTLPQDESAVSYNYGSSVAIDGDYAVVGAPLYSNYEGKAYVLYNNGRTWETLAELTVSDGSVGDYFGYSVSISGDNIVVGAKGEDSSVGSAYVFTKSMSGWANMTETAKLSASDGESNDYFGWSVGISGNTIVVGTLFGDRIVTDAGACYIFNEPESGWVDMTEIVKLTVSEAEDHNYFGRSVSISGDNIVVGAYGEGSYTGSAYVYTKPDAGWSTISTHTAKFTASDGATGDRFGVSVSISGNDLLVGASHDVNIGDNTGSAYVFTKEGSWQTTSSYKAKLIASDGGTSDYFGYSVCLSGDNIVVGAYYNDDNGINSGSAYVFTKLEDDWSTTSANTTKLSPVDGAAADHFGVSVSISGNDVVVGAYYDDDNGANSGSVYMFTNSPIIKSVVRQSPTTVSVASNSLVFRVSFNKDVNNVGASDFEVNGFTTAAISNVTMLNAYVYDVTISGGDLSSFDGEVGLNISSTTDITDNDGGVLYQLVPAINEMYIVDNVVPTVVLTTDETTAKGNFEVTFTFNEKVEDFEASDITVTNGSISGALVMADSITYIATISPLVNGDITINIATAVVQDLAGNDNEASTELVVTANFGVPTVTLSAAETIVNGDFDVSITFSESVSGFEASDLTVTNGIVSGALSTSDNITFIATITPTLDGLVVIGVAAATAQNSDGRNNMAATNLEVTYSIPSSIDDASAEKNDIKVCPNPTTGMFKIPLNTELEMIALSIYNIKGELVYSNPTYYGGWVDVTDINQGLYIVNVITDGNIKIIKLLKK